MRRVEDNNKSNSLFCKGIFFVTNGAIDYTCKSYHSLKYCQLTVSELIRCYISYKFACNKLRLQQRTIFTVSVIKFYTAMIIQCRIFLYNKYQHSFSSLNVPQQVLKIYAVVISIHKAMCHTFCVKLVKKSLFEISNS